jgi:IS1 family transposase
MTRAWLFPPATQEVQFDEKWSFVGKKQKRCDPHDPADARQGDCWDHVAFDPEHRLVISVVVGKRTDANAGQVVHEFYERTDGRIINLMTSDEYPAYAAAIADRYADAAGRLPDWLAYATVHKTRVKNRVVKVDARVVFGTLLTVAAALVWSLVSWCVTTVFVERSHGTDRQRNARKTRKTYRFSKAWGVHTAMTYFTLYSYNFCWPVRTLREQVGPKRYRHRTPAMTAGLTDHIWSLEEWLLFPSSGRFKLPCWSPE